MHAYNLSSDSQSQFILVGQPLGLPIVILIFTGVCFLHRELTRQLKENQERILNPEESSS
jgi:hypothetical protein